jgi:hypothetical protein
MSAWVDQMFRSKIAKRGEVVRRKISSIGKFASRALVEAECRRRGFHIVEHGDQWLIFCDKAAIRIVV